MTKGSSYFLFNITQSLKCIKSIWLPSGPQMRLISTKIWGIGRNSIKRNDTSLNMCWHSSLPAMVSFWKTWPNSFAPRSRSRRPGVSTVSKLPWKTFTLRHILFLLTPILRTCKKNNICLMPSLMWRLSRRKPTGRWSGWIKLTLSKKDWLPLLQLREYFSQVLSARFSGWRKEVLCQDSHFLMNLFLEMKAFIPILPATFTRSWRISSKTKGSKKSSVRQSKFKRNLFLNPFHQT